MKCNEEEEDDPGDSLDQVEPVPRVRIIEVIGSRFNCNHQSIDCVIDERYKDAANLDEEDVRD